MQVSDDGFFTPEPFSRFSLRSNSGTQVVQRSHVVDLCPFMSKVNSNGI